MGVKLSKNTINFKSYNLDKIYESIITNNIISNILYENNSDIIICLQGLRNFNTLNNNKFYYDINLGLLFYSNFNILNHENIYFSSNTFNRLSYGFQYFLINFKDFNLGIINIDVIENYGNLYNYNEIKKNQINNMLNFIKKKNNKINLITNLNFNSVDYNLIDLNKLFDNESNLNNNKLYLYINNPKYYINKNEIIIENIIIKIINKKINFINSLNKNGVEFEIKIE